MCLAFFPQKICCALISLIVFPEKKKSSPIVRTICIPVCAYVYVSCVYVCILLLLAHYKCIFVIIWITTRAYWLHLILVLYELDCEIRAPTPLWAVLYNTSLVLDFIKISRWVVKYWCGRHICQFKLPSKAYRPCGRKLPFHALRPLNC